MKPVILLIVLAAAVFGLAAFAADAQLRERALNAGADARAVRAQLIANTLDHTLQLRMVQTFTFAALPSLRGLAASDPSARSARMAVAQEELQAMVAADPNMRAASIVDKLGTVILTTDASINADWSTRVFVREALAGHLHGSVPSRDYGEVSQYYSAPILDNGGNVAGALVLRVAAQDLWDTLADERNVFVVDDNGVRIADRSQPSQLFVAIVPPTANSLTQLLMEHHYGAEMTQLRATNLPDLARQIAYKQPTAIYRDASGKIIYAALRRMQIVPWTVVAFDSEDAIGDQARGVFWEAVRVPLVGLVIAWGILLAVAWIFYRPVKEMN